MNLNIEFVLSYRRDSIVGLANVFPHVLTSDLGDIEDWSNLIRHYAEQKKKHFELVSYISQKLFSLRLPLQEPLGIAFPSTLFQLIMGLGSP